MDSSHVSMVYVMLNADGFETYRCDTNISLGVNMDLLHKVSKCAGNDDSILLQAERTGDYLSAIFKKQEESRVSLYKMRLMDLDIEQLGIPNHHYSCKVSMPSADFHDICKDLMSTIGDAVFISIEPGNITFKCNGDEGNANISIAEREGEIEKKVEIKCEEPTECKYTLRYLNLFTKATPLSSQVVLQMSEDYPLVVGYTIHGIGEIKYFLAPNIADNDY